MTDEPTVADLALQVELLQEALADAGVAKMFAAEDAGWARLDNLTGDTITRETIVTEAKRARVMAIADPLIRRGVSLHVAYVHGQGVTIAAAQEEDAEQDVNAAVQAFLDDPSNQATFTSQQAREELERKFKTDGNAFHALPTSPLTGRVQVRSIPLAEVVDIITDPEDAATPWFYKREWTAHVVEAGNAPGSTRTRRETRRALYPALGYRPRLRPKAVDGIPVEWDTPVLHTAVNRPEGSRWGVPDLLAAMPWALGYKDFLEDWARLVKALSRFAFRATSKARNAATVRGRLASAPVGDDGVGATVITGEGQKFEAIGKSGATIDSESGRPLAAMVAAALDVPVTMLLADPGATGARATAETLDQPLQLVIRARQSLHAGLYVRVLDHVIDSAIRAPQGMLKGVVRIDPVTGREALELAGGQSRGLSVDWPSIDKIALDLLIKAIVDADGTGKLPPLFIAKLLAVALDADDVDEVLAQLVDDDGNFVYPDDAAAAASALNAVAGYDQLAALTPAELKAKADAMGVLIRSGVDPESAAAQVGLDGLDFTGAMPVALRPPGEQA